MKHVKYLLQQEIQAYDLDDKLPFTGIGKHLHSQVRCSGGGFTDVVYVCDSRRVFIKAVKSQIRVADDDR
ncbi:hypothetical protein [Pelotalea chapellei]|uniref:hypothetical protein n=1 Tax=Pelotalea chapellei TaxID=44671 RepID=UPI001FE97EDB|nr:hypothetical protein [Pelotalea chapellei]